MIIWRVRHIESGLYWNDVRWAGLDGTFSELGVVSLDDERELVRLQTSGGDIDKSFRELHVGDQVVGSGRLNLGFRGEPGIVVRTEPGGIWVQFPKYPTAEGHFMFHRPDRIGAYLVT
jgi:hypothetical protein